MGKINPKAGNWQSARIGNSETIALSEGKNVISIATAAQVRKIIAETAKKIGNKPYNVNKTYGSWNQWYGYGLVNAYEAVKKANGI